MENKSPGQQDQSTTQTINPAILDKQVKSSILPALLLIIGIVGLVLPTVFGVTILPQLFQLSNQLQSNTFNPFLSFGFIGLLVIIFLLDIVWGGMFLVKQRKLGSLKDSQKRTAKILLGVGLIGVALEIPILLVAIIYPIYSITSSF